MRAGTRAVAVAALIAAVALRPAPAAATTTIAADGANVTITVPIDLVGLPEDGGRITDMDTGEQHVYSDWLETRAEAIWNDAFARLPYRGCLTFDLDIEIHPVRTHRDRGHHRIDFDPFQPGNAIVYDPGVDHHNEDGTRAYTDPLLGDFGLITQETFAHEVGHLLGLGDDYLRDADKNVIDGAVAGREEGTLMHGSDSTTITQAIVDRVGALIDEVQDLPQCWTGTMEAIGTYGVDLPEGSLGCDYAWTADFTFTVDRSGRAAGSGNAAIDPSSGCIEVLAPAGYPGATPVSFEVEGVGDDDAFALVFTRDLVPTFPYHILTANPETIEIVKSDPCTAAATVQQGTEDFKRQAGVEGPGWDVVSTTHIELRCRDEQPD